jgi:putative hemolysin
MDDIPLIKILTITCISVLFSAFFSGMEIAFLSANRLRIELDKKQGSIPAKIVSTFYTKRPSLFIGTMLLGNNIALVVYGITMAILLEPFIINNITPLDSIVMLIQTIISTTIILFAAEFIPKNIFRIDPNRTLNLFSIPLLPVYFLLYPPVVFTIGVAEIVLRIFNVPKSDKEEFAFGRIDLDNIVKEGTNHLEDEDENVDHEIQIFKNALDFSKIKARDCMIPRTEIIAVNLDEDIAILKQKFIKTGLSKILVFRETIDNIIGYVHSYELFKQPKSIKSILLPVSIIPETIPAKEVLEDFIKQRKSIAVVVDEFGGTSGILTIEDIVEEIFGDIEDEHDNEDLIEEKVSDKEFNFSGRLEIDYLNDKYRLNIPESEEYDTLAGYILFHIEDIPEKSQRVTINQFVITIVDVSQRKIEKINLKIKD